jgi:glycosyltransferase involved in cell wall biosynthesis
MLRVVAYAEREDGWGRLARAFSAALNRYEPTELVNWGFHKPGRLTSLLRRLRGLDDWQCVTISLGSVERAPFLRGRHRIIYFVWETTRIPARYRTPLQQVDMIWTPSRWGQQILESNGIDAAQVRVVPAGVDTSLFVPPEHPRREGEPFRFLSVGKWEERKGIDDLVSAFTSEFTPDEPMELVLQCGSPWPRPFDLRERLAARLAGLPRARVFVNDPLPLPALVALMQQSHAFVLPTRAEAWGLPILEAMACGLPCIVTNYSGLTTFAHDENAYLVRVESMRPVEDDEFFDPAVDWGEWAQPDLAHLRTLMRHVCSHHDEAKRRGLRARGDAERLWSWDRAAQIAMDHVRELRGAGRSRAPA